MNHNGGNPQPDERYDGPGSQALDEDDAYERWRDEQDEEEANA